MGWMEDQIPFLDNYLQRITAQLKLVFSFVFSSLTLQAFTILYLVIYNFEQVIISRNYFS